MDRAVAESDEGVVLLNRDTRFIDGFSADFHFLARVLQILSVAQHHDERIVVLDEFRLFVFDDTDDGERGVGNAAHRADRQRGSDRFHAVLHLHPLRHHRGNDLGGQCGKDVGLDAAAHAVGQNDDCGIFALRNDIDMVAAELLAVFIQAHEADIST